MSRYKEGNSLGTEETAFVKVGSTAFSLMKIGRRHGWKRGLEDCRELSRITVHSSSKRSKLIGVPNLLGLLMPGHLILNSEKWWQGPRM